jgi:hypothetical protein
VTLIHWCDWEVRSTMPEIDATEVLGRMAAVYASARTYTDRGSVTTTFIHPGKRRINRLPFRTAFERPHRFRYEFTDESLGHRLVIWQETPPAKMFWTVEGRVETHELLMALARATGISGGSAMTIPRLLIPELAEGSRGVTDLEDALQIGQELIEDIPCFLIRGRLNSSTVTVSLGVDDLLVRRIFQRHHFGPEEHAQALASLPEDLRVTAQQNNALTEDFDTETETLYSPSKDTVLDSAAFDSGLG